MLRSYVRVSHFGSIILIYEKQTLTGFRSVAARP